MPMFALLHEPYLWPKVQSSGENRCAENAFARSGRRGSTEVDAANGPCSTLSPTVVALENGLRGGTGGGSGIRTHDTVSRIHAFQASAFSHSATPPGTSSAI